MTEKFFLKWNDFHSNLSSSIGILRNEDYLQDVTLVTDGHHQTSAHKLVLSVGSEYFQTIFKNNNHTNLMICLEGISKKDLKSCLDYMYNGEVQVYHEDLDRFLSIAQRFQIKGLQTDYDGSSKNYNPNSEKYANEQTFEYHKNSFDHDQHKEHEDIIKTENQRNFTPTNNARSLVVSENFNLLAEKEKNIEDLMDGSLMCKLCGKIFNGTSRANMRQHVETHVEGLTFSCDDCGKTFSKSESLRKHKYREKMLKVSNNRQ